MIRLWFIPLFLFLPATLHADLVMEQKSSDTNQTRTVTIKLHGDKLRMDEGDGSLSAIVDLKTRDSITLIHKGKTFMQRFGSEIHWQMDEERKHTHGTNDMDAPAAAPKDTGKSETVNGQAAEIFTWSGARGLTETLWVVKNFPNYDAIKPELLKLDQFNDGGPHRNAQPPVGGLPGMVIKSESVMNGNLATNVLILVKIEPVDPALFAVPADYSPYKHPERTNSP